MNKQSVLDQLNDINYRLDAVIEYIQNEQGYDDNCMGIQRAVTTIAEIMWRLQQDNG